MARTATSSSPVNGQVTRAKCGPSAKSLPLIDRVGKIGQAHRRRLQRQADGEIGVLLDFIASTGMSEFGRAAIVVAKAGGNIADP